MKFYHRTTTDNWIKIQEEGVLWGQHSYRYTYLSPFDVGDSYGDVLLEVNYEPKGNPDDNYGFNPPKGQVCWQFSVFKPISIANVKVVSQMIKHKQSNIMTFYHGLSQDKWNKSIEQGYLYAMNQKSVTMEIV